MEHEVTRILVVEDEISHALLLKHVFDKSNKKFEVTIAGTIREAYDILSRDVPDLVLADIRLPDGSGTDLLVRENGALKYPVVLMTSFGNEQVAADVIKSGALDYVVKSSESFKAMVQTVERALRAQAFIVERRRAIDALRESEQRFRELFNNMSSGVAVFEVIEDGGDFIFKDFNRGAEQIERISKDEVIGKSVTEVFAGVKEFGLFDILQRVWRTGNREHHQPSLYGDGRISGWRENYVYKLPSGEIVAVYDDITERMKAEEELKKTQEQQQAILDNIPDIAWLKDYECRFIAVNAPFAKSCGHTPEELVGKTDFDIWPVDLAERYRADDLEVIETGLRKQVEEPLDMADGRRLYIETVKTPIYNDRGEIIGTTGISRDITARKHAEELIRGNLEMLQTIIDTIPSPIFYKDTHNVFLGCNRAFEKFAGFPKDRIIGHTAYDILPPDEADLKTKQEMEFLNNPGIRSFEETVVTPDGVSRYVLTHHAVFTDSKGDPAGTVVVMLDLTDRKKAEDQLRAQEEILSNIISNIPYGVFWKDRNSVYLGGNKLFAKLAGVESLEAIVGKNDYDLAWKKEESDFYRKIDKEVMESGDAQINFEETQLDALGNDMIIMTSKVPLRNESGEVFGILGMYTDITDRKLSELEHAKLAAIVDQAAETIIVTDLDGRIEYVNPAFTKTTGFCPEEIIGLETRSLICDKSDGSLYEQILQTLLNGQIWTGRIPMKHKNGSILNLGASICSVKDSSGNAVSNVIIGRDISERLVLEKELRQAQKLESIGQLAAGIAHEINTPMQYVGDNTRFLVDSFAGILELVHVENEMLEAAKSGSLTDDLIEKVEKAKEETDIQYLSEEIPKALDQSLDGIGRVSKIVHAMKEFSHPGVDERVSANLNGSIESTITVSRNEWKYVAELETAFDPTLPSVQCFPGEFNQVILNLITNAAHAISKKLGKMPTEKGKITVSTSGQGEWVEVRITDTGTGIPEEIRERVFDPFFTTKEVGKGTGQGLAIAHSVIVEKHGGSITFETVEGEGTTFIIRLPVNPAASIGKKEAVEESHV